MTDFLLGRRKPEPEHTNWSKEIGLAINFLSQTYISKYITWNYRSNGIISILNYTKSDLDAHAFKQDTLYYLQETPYGFDLCKVVADITHIYLAQVCCSCPL